MVDDGEDAIIVIAFGQVGDEIHQDVLKGSFVDVSVESLKGGFLSRDIGFQFLTIGASLYILFDECLESWSFIMLSYEVPGIGNSWMSCCG